MSYESYGVINPLRGVENSLRASPWVRVKVTVVAYVTDFIRFVIIKFLRL